MSEASLRALHRFALVPFHADRRFRNDLYYRLNLFPALLAPLRKRRDDIPILARRFTQRFAPRMVRRVEAIRVAETGLLRRGQRLILGKGTLKVTNVTKGDWLASHRQTNGPTTERPSAICLTTLRLYRYRSLRDAKTIPATSGFLRSALRC